ncbi:MAG: polyprenyl synthetase family protein [Planctomycetota bacterium]
MNTIGNIQNNIYRQSNTKNTCNDIIFNGVDLKPIEKNLRNELGTFRYLLKKAVISSNGISDLISHFKSFQGKYLRPILTMLSAKAVISDKPLDSNHFNLAVIVELIHNATLVHDDVLDEAKLRRNVKTYNQRWGNEMAVLFGDYLFARFLSHSTLIESPELLKAISETSNQICVGELEHMLKRFNLRLSEKDYLKIIYNKTASLFALSTYLGTVISTANKKTINALTAYGKNFGMAYQIMDDYHDIIDSEKTSGKSIGNDLFKGKITLPVIQAFRKSSKTHQIRLKKLINSILVNGNKLSTSKKRFYDILEQTGSLSYTHQMARNYVNLAIKNLAVLKDSIYKDLLTSLAKSIVS